MYSTTAAAKNGAYGFAPQPTSSNRGRGDRVDARAASDRSHAASGARTAYVGDVNVGRRRAAPESATRGQPEAEPRERVDRQSGDDPFGDPQAGDEENPEQAERRAEAAAPA
jgi:hypothetical protein